MAVKRKKDNTFVRYVLDQLGNLEGATSRAMFGGHGLYCRGTFFGIVFGDRLYFKTDAITRVRYEERGMKAFQPSASQRLGNYMEVPGDILEDAPSLVEWALESVRAAAG